MAARLAPLARGRRAQRGDRRPERLDRRRRVPSARAGGCAPRRHATAQQTTHPKLGARLWRSHAGRLLRRVCHCGFS